MRTKPQKATGEWFDPRLGQGLVHRLLVIDHQPAMPSIIRHLLAALLKSKELSTSPVQERSNWPPEWSNWVGAVHRP